MRIRRLSLLLVVLLLCSLVTGCGGSGSKEEPSPYAEYVIPWERDVSQIAADAQELHFYFMSGEGMTMHLNNDQGQTEKWGDACLVILPTGETMMVDGADAIYTPVLMENLKRLGVEKIDYLFVSHPHSDHFGGLFDSYGVVYNMPVGQAYYNGDKTQNIADHFKLEDIPYEVLQAGDTLELGGVKFTVLNPTQDQLDNPVSNDPTTQQNCASLVFRMDYGDFSALFTGDIYTAEEKRLVAEYKDTGLLDVDMIKLPHHGDTTSSCSEWADEVKPVIGVATGAVPLDFPLYFRYSQYGKTVLCDYLDGYVHVFTDGTEDGLQWETSRERTTDAYDGFDNYADKNK